MACENCRTGFLHRGTPKGRVETLYELPCYITEPTSGQEPKATIVLITDAFGWELPNSRLLADNYAHKGQYRVLVPDFMDGHWMDHGGMTAFSVLDDNQASYYAKGTTILSLVKSFVPFLYFTRLGVCQPRVNAFFRALRSDFSGSVGVAGFCWGGKHVTLLCSGVEKSADGTKPLVDCGFTAHPSFLSVPTDLDAVTLPLSIANGTLDIQLKGEAMEQAKHILEAKPGCELVVYEGAKHGFAMRGNPDNDQEMRQGVQAEEQALAFYARFLTSESKL